MQQTQPLPRSATSSVVPRTSASSIPTAPYSLMMTAVARPSGVARKRRTSVVLPAPRKPVTIVTGMRAPRARFCRRPNGPRSREGNRSSAVMMRSGPVARIERSEIRVLEARQGGPAFRFAQCGLRRKPGSSKIHLQDVEPAREAVDRVDDFALVDEHVVELDRVHLGHARGRWHEGGDLSRLVRIGKVVGAQAAVEERADDNLLG